MRAAPELARRDTIADAPPDRPDVEDHSEWNTPPEFLELVRRLDTKRRIGLDPCSNATSLVHAQTSYTKADDGLAHPWTGHGVTFVNGPYDFIDPWIIKGHAEFIAIDRTRLAVRDQLLVLCAAKTDTKWFHDYAAKYDRVLFVRGRIKFLRPELSAQRIKGNGRFGSLVLYAGAHTDRFDEHFGPLGWMR